MVTVRLLQDLRDDRWRGDRSLPAGSSARSWWLRPGIGSFACSVAGGLLSDHAPDEIPASHRDLAECPPVAALSTVTPDGYPQTSVVWCDFDGQCLRVNTMRGFAKERNMRCDRRVTLLCYDPRRPQRYLEVRGMVVEMTEAGAAGHLDALASKYAGRPVRFFGDVIPASFAETETPVLCRIRPSHVVAADAPGPARCAGQEMKHVSGPIAPEPLPVPASHLDLLTRPICGVFTTFGHDGQPQSTVVWVDLDRGCALTRKYTSQPAYYGYIYPEAQRLRETRVICRIHSRRITLDAIHIADH
jgi:PPOX class probable F420-dependent enzyme